MTLNSLSNFVPRARDMKKRIKKWDFIKIKIFCIAKENISKMKREPTVWENIFVNNALDKALISKIHKELTQFQIWYLSFPTWLISLSIMLSSSIHAVAKGRSSFFLSDV